MDTPLFPMDVDDKGNPVRIRLDLLQLSQFVKAREHGGVADEVSSINLFWEVWQPRCIPIDDTDERDSLGSYSKNSPLLSYERETALLEELARLERECRIGYEPDTENWRSGTSMEQFNVGSQYIHVGAASALRHWKRNGLSDYVTQTLEEVSRVLYLLGIFPTFDMTEARGDIVTLFGVGSLVLGVISRVKYLDRKYEEAFWMGAWAVESFGGVSEAVDLDDEFLVGIVQEDFQEQDRSIRAAIRRCLPLLSLEPQQVIDAFEALRLQGKSESWRLVAIHCSLLALTFDDELWGTEILDGNGQTELWNVFWHRAEGWATAQLSTNDLREYMRQQEREASEKRLKSYFFGDFWEKLPEKAREGLVNIDYLWFTSTRGTNVGAVLNDLQVAAETMCYQYLWEPLREAPGGQALLAFKARDADLDGKGFFPTLSDYAWACRGQFFREFVNGTELPEEDQRFLLQRLPRALNELYKTRNPSQHNPAVRLTRQEVEPFVRRFLGIGQEGLLRRLAEIGPKLARR